MLCKDCKIKMDIFDFVLESSEYDVMVYEDVQGMLFYKCPICGIRLSTTIKANVNIYAYLDKKWIE